MAADAPAAFFSYCRDDSDFALRLAEDLKAAGAVVWIDQLDIEPGMRWDRAVEAALNNCPRMLVILSPVSVESDNVRDEISFAVRKQKTIIPVLYLDCDIPLRLERHQHIDFRTDHARGLSVLLKALGVQPPTQPTASASVPSGTRPKVSEADERAADQVKLEKERKQAAERARSARLEQKRKHAVKQLRSEQERKQGAEQSQQRMDIHQRIAKEAIGVSDLEEGTSIAEPAQLGQEQETLKLRELLTLTGHAGSVNAVAVTPDGQRAVSASEDHTLKVWDLESGLELRTLTGHSREVYAVAVTDGGQRAVSASDDKTLKVWDVASGRELRTLIGHAGPVWAAAVTPDGQRAVSASGDKTLKVWELGSGIELHTLTGHAHRVNAVTLTPDGERVVSASGDRTLKVWEVASGREFRTLTGHLSWVRAVAVTPDGQRAVSASGDQTLKVWELASGRELRTLTGHSRGVYAVAVMSDGQRAVSASYDKTLKVWELASGRELATFEADASLDCCAVSPDGKTILAGDARGVIHCLRLE